MRKIWLLFLMGSISLASFGQEDPAGDKEEEKEKFLAHYVGIQINELVRQAVNLNLSETFQHPYYINYTINHHKTGWGLNFGFGYDYRNTMDGDAITRIETKIDDWVFRLGPEKKFYLGKKIIVGVGLDYFRGEDFNNTYVVSDSDPLNFSENTTQDYVKIQGGSVRISFSYRLSKWLLIGTEAGYAYSKEDHIFISENRLQFQSQETYSLDENSFELRNAVFQTPAAIFLIISF